MKGALKFSTRLRQSFLTQKGLRPPGVAITARVGVTHIPVGATAGVAVVSVHVAAGSVHVVSITARVGVATHVGVVHVAGGAGGSRRSSGSGGGRDRSVGGRHIRVPCSRVRIVRCRAASPENGNGEQGKKS